MDNKTDSLRIRKRLGPPPANRENLCVLHKTCPDLFELASGDFAVIGQDITADLSERLPQDAGCGTNERIVLIPRSLLLAARNDIPLA